MKLTFSELTWQKAIALSEEGQQSLPGAVLPATSLYGGTYYMGARCPLASSLDPVLRVSVDG